MDIAIPTTSKTINAKNGKRRKRTKAFGRRGRKTKIVRFQVEEELTEPQNTFEIEKILRKAEFITSGGENKYLVSWPNTWEPIENLGNCPELLEQFEASLPQIIEIDDDDKIFPSEWVVEKILDKRCAANGKVEYHLKWQSSWVNAKDIPPEQVQDYEDQLTLEKRKAMDSQNAYNNNNNDDEDADEVDDVDDSGVKIKKEDLKRKRSTSFDEMSEIEPKAKRPTSHHKKVEESKVDSPKVIEMELITLYEQRKIDRIIDMGRSNDGSFTFMLKFVTGEYGIIKRQVANIKYPQEVIAFYQSRIDFF